MKSRFSFYAVLCMVIAIVFMLVGAPAASAAAVCFGAASGLAAMKPTPPLVINVDGDDSPPMRLRVYDYSNPRDRETINDEFGLCPDDQPGGKNYNTA